MPAAAAAGPSSAAPSGGGGGNPFQLATNLYCEKNNVGNLASTTVTTSQTAGGGQINAGQYLRGIRLVVRAQASASVTTQQGATTDGPWNFLTQLDFVNVDGSEILYVMGGYAHYLAQKYGRPWLGDPMEYPDAANATTAIPQFTLFLQPEIRWTAGVLANPLALDTPVETRSGWKIIDDVRAGDEVLGSDQRWTPVLGVSEVFTGRDCYRLTIGDEQIICDGEHRWPTTDAHGAEKLRTTAELADGGAYRITGHEKISGIEPVPSVPTKCLATGRDDHLFLVGRTHIPTRNTDTRSQYRFDYSVDTVANITAANGSSYNAASQAPIVTVQPYMDAWAQPDAEDLQGTPNQPVPPGLNLQSKRRHQIFTMNANNSDNILQSALTGNAIRNQIFVTRNGGSIRSEGFTDPILWQLDNRSLGKISTNNPGTGAGTASSSGQSNGDMVQNWMTEMYADYFSTRITGGTLSTNGFTRETGVYVFPRFIKPGEMYGQGWLYTANSTKETFETTTGALTTGTAELITDEVYPVGPVDPQLTDI
jgi:hypothetical protein